jgi:flagellar hook-associated protein 2
MATTSSISSTTSSSLTSQIDTMVTQYKATLVSQYVTPLDDKKTTLQARLNALATLKTKLKSLSDAAATLTGSSGLTKFKAYSVESSNSSVATATASSSASPGSFTLFVSSLAKADTVLSSRMTSAGTSIAANEFTSEEQTAGEATRELRVKVNGNEVATISIALTSSDTDRTVMEKIRDAINNSSAASQYVSAAVVSDTSTTSRLTLLSKSTGTENSLSFEDVSGTLLDNIGLTDEVVSNRSASTSTAAGYVVSDANNLNAQFVLNGVDFISGTNTIANVLPGITLQLKSAQSPTDSPVQLNVSSDTSTVQSSIQSFIDAYNSVITYIRQQTAVNPDSGTRQIFAGDMMVTRLRISLQSYMSQAVSGVTSNYNALFKVGITQNSDGTLTISDSSKLSTALKNDVNSVINLFGYSDDSSNKGVAVRIQNALSGLIGSDGQIESTRTTLNSQMTSIKSRIDAANLRVTKQAEQYKAQFTKLLATYQEMVAQQTYLQSLTDALYSYYYS